MSRPFISVLIDTFNHERFIEAAVNSVLAQAFPTSDREILVVDDGSTDKTSEILHKFEPQIRILRKPNGGQASAFNVGIPECRGELIAFLDGDDRWLPGKLSHVAGLMAADPSLGAVGHAIVQATEGGLEQIIAPMSQTRFRLDSVASAQFFRLNRCYLGTSRLTLRAQIARRILPIPESLVFEADEYLFTLAPILADAVILPDPLTCYRIHGSNLFMAPGALPGGERRKQRVLASLASELRCTLSHFGVAPEVMAVILEMVEAEAAQLRLQLDGGYPWETFRAESAVFRIQHHDAPWRSRAFRAVSMLPALLLPPRWFYAGRRWLSSQSWYLRVRRAHLPVPGLTRVPAPPDSGASKMPKL